MVWRWTWRWSLHVPSAGRLAWRAYQTKLWSTAVAKPGTREWQPRHPHAASASFVSSLTLCLEHQMDQRQIGAVGHITGEKKIRSGPTFATCQARPEPLWSKFNTPECGFMPAPFTPDIILLALLPSNVHMEEELWQFAVCCRDINTVARSPCRCVYRFWRKRNVATLETAPLRTARRREKCGCTWKITTVSSHNSTCFDFCAYYATVCIRCIKDIQSVW